MLCSEAEDSGHPGRGDWSFEANIQEPHRCTKSALLRAMWPGPGTIYGESNRRLVIFFNLQAVLCSYREADALQRLHANARTHACTHACMYVHTHILELLVNCVLYIRGNEVNCEITHILSGSKIFPVKAKA